MSQKSRPTDKEHYNFSKLSKHTNETHTKSTKRTNVYHGFTEKSKQMVVYRLKLHLL